MSAMLPPLSHYLVHVFIFDHVKFNTVIIFLILFSFGHESNTVRFSVTGEFPGCLSTFKDLVLSLAETTLGINTRDAA